MHDLTQLRRTAREIFDEALRAVDPLSAVRSAVHVEESRLIIGELSCEITARAIYAIAIGKAGEKMAAGLNQVLGSRFSAGILCSHDVGINGSSLGPAWEIFRGGHPEPNAASLAAARACFELLAAADKSRALVIFLISGGGSAMIELPASDEISLSDLRAANKLLVSCGATISEINAVRRAFSAVKGGQLAARAPHCDKITLVVSDVPEGEEYNVASGPTIAPDLTSFDAGDVIDRYQLRGELPPPVIRAINKAQRPLTGSASRSEHLVLLSNNDARRAAAEAARRCGFVTEISPDISDQPIEQGCTKLLESLGALSANSAGNMTGAQPSRLPSQCKRGRLRSSRVVCLISGGEFACPARGGGVGGRNLETALRLALAQARSDTSGRFVALCAGTDGIDGNSSAAGAVVDDTTLERARSLGLSAEKFLERSDSYSFFAALGEAITTGSTGTNVRDLRILLAERSTNSH
jgi:hydroxypyruvate reductase